MSGASYVDTLRKLEYPRLDKLNVQLLNRQFSSQEATQSFISWFNKHLNSKHVLKPAELRSFKQLQDSGAKILDGKKLEDSLREFTVNESVLTKDRNIYDDNLERCLTRKEMLLHCRASLDHQLTTISKRLSKSQPLIEKSQEKYTEAEQKCQEDNSKMQLSLRRLTNSVKNLTSVYCQPAGNSQPNFLSQTSLKDYYNAEQRFHDEMNCYIKKQFLESAADMDLQDDSSRYQLLEVSKPESLLIRGEQEVVNIGECKELKRLQNVYHNSEMALITAILEHEFISASCRFLEKLSASSNEKKNCLASPVRLMEETKRKQLKQEIFETKCRDEIVPLIDQNASSRGTKILTGDYELKLSRQKYFLTKLEEVLQQAVWQQSRSEFLLASYRVEDQHQHDVHHLLTSIQMELSNIKDRWTKRMAVLEEFSVVDEKYQRNTIDSRNKYMKSLNDFLTESTIEDSKGPSEKQLCISYSSMVGAAESLSDRRSNITERLTLAKERQTERLEMMEDFVEKCEEKLYRGADSQRSPESIPVLSAELKATTIQLKETLEKLHKELESIFLEYKNKKTHHKSDWLTAKERQLFVHFYTDPSKLKEDLQEVETRLKAHNIAR